MDIEYQFKKCFTDIEKTQEFKNINDDIKSIYYTLYLKCKRIYYAIIILKNSRETYVNFIETLPLFRVFLEGFFHLSYIMSNPDTKKLKEGYTKLSELTHHLAVRKMRHSSSVGNDSKVFIDTFSKSVKLPKEMNFLDDIGAVAKKTGKGDLYRKHYTVLNSFVHFNLSTFTNYGVFEDDKFIFNKQNNLESYGVYNLLNKTVYIFIVEIVNYLKNVELEKTVNERTETWAKRILEESGL